MMHEQKTYEWAVIGGGPAGIIAVGKLLDNDIHPENILWIDPVFRVGDFGTLWKKVPSNTQVKTFLKTLMACKAFQYDALLTNVELNQCNPEATCLLSVVSMAFQVVSDNLRHRVVSMMDKVTRLSLYQRRWEIYNEQENVSYAKNVVLAIGAEPKSLALPHAKEITLEIALNPERLATVIEPNDTIAVFGSSHSAMLALKNVLENARVKLVINFYLEPLKYATQFSEWTLFDNTGLKGDTAQWAKENIDGQWPEKLDRKLSDEHNLREVLPRCDKVIYGTGFEKREIMVEGLGTLQYNNKNGIIAPGLFGLGIGFPELGEDPFGNVELRVGIWKFMDYIQRVMPIWLAYGT